MFSEYFTAIPTDRKYIRWTNNGATRPQEVHDFAQHSFPDRLDDDCVCRIRWIAICSRSYPGLW